MAGYAYREIRTPAFEFTDLFKRGVGEETDIVNKEMYTFTDQGGKSLTLKPELTAPVVRAWIQNNLGAESPLSRLYYIDALFRQERPQKGRQRQFHQFGAEAIGSPHPEQDVEIIAIAYDICAFFAPQDLKVRLNTIGSPDARKNYLVQLKSALEPHINHFGEQDQRRFHSNPLRLFDSKDPATQAIMAEHAPHISDHISHEDRDHHEQVRAGLEAMDIPYHNDHQLVRGLDYYTRTVFEITSGKLGGQDAVCGGGRYDGLVEQLGGKSVPAVGFAAGIERLIIIAGDDLKEQAPQPEVDVYLVVLGNQAIPKALGVASEIRAAGLTVQMETLRRSPKAQFREANRTDAAFAVTIGENELAAGACAVKNLSDSSQSDVAFDEIVSYLTKALGI